MVPHVPAPHTTGGGKRVQLTLASVLHDEISVAHHRFLKLYTGPRVHLNS